MDGDLIPVVSYERSSLKRGAHTVPEQQRINRRTAAARGWRVVHSFADTARSAAKIEVEREEFEAMLRVLRVGSLPDGTPVQGVIVTADDRLSRSSTDYERFLDAFTSHPGRVYGDAKTTKHLYSEDVESMGLIGAVLSRMEAKKIRRRVTSMHRSLAETGKVPLGPRPFGWKADKKTLDPEESEAIRVAVAEFIAGRSLGSIVREWQDRGLVSAQGKPWSYQGLKGVIMSARLCGYRELHGELMVHEDGEPVVGEWETITTPQQWQAIRAIFEARRGKLVNDRGVVRDLAVDHREHSYLLTGTLRCGYILADGAMCMAKLRAGVRKRLGDYAYHCRSRSQGGCGSLGRKGDLVDMYVSEMVLAKLEERTLRAPRLGPWAKQSELDEFNEQKSALRAAFAERAIKPSDFFAELRRVDADIDRLTKERQLHAAVAEQARTDVTDIRRRWYSDTDKDRLDISQKRAYVRRVLEAVIVHPSGRTGGRGFNPDLLEPVWREDV